MPRWANRTDANHVEIMNALRQANRCPIQGRDSDCYARHVDGHGMLLEFKTKHGKLRPIQHELRALFLERYAVVRSVSEALAACGIKS